MIDDAAEFPAAHSMDSTWWAVDRDGHVALFATGEAGAVPNNYYGGQDIPHEDALLALPVTEPRFDLNGHRAMHPGEHTAMTYGSNFVAFVRDAAAVRDIAPEIVGATSGAAAVFTYSHATQLAELHARGACISCGYSIGYRPYAAHGAYVYDHVTENWICGPYARLLVPERPAHIDSLPAELADRAARFDGRFADRVELQPAEHWDCWGHGSAWLALDRRTVRPLPPESEYWQETAIRLRERFPQLVFIPEPNPDE